MNEEWKVIEGFDFAYRVSSFGRVEGTGGLMKPYDTETEELRVPRG